MLQRLKAVRFSLSFLLVFFTLVPAARLAYILAITGANNQSSDDIYLIHEFVSKALQGGYRWGNIFHDTFHNTHSNVVPGLVYLAFARLFHLNVYTLLYAGVLLAAIRVVVLHSAFTMRAEDGNRLASRMMWPMMSALIFSVSQMSVFEQDLQTIKTNVCELGVAVAIWGLVRFPGRSRAVWLASAGGLLASFSFASGLAIWPIALAAMLCLGFRKFAHYAIWVAGALISASPYLYFLLISKDVPSSATFQGPFRVGFILRYLGYPFTVATKDPTRELVFTMTIGGVAVGLFCFGILLLYRKCGRKAIVSAAAPLLLSAFGLVTSWQISLFRELLAPWYVTFALDFWLGLAGLAFVVWSKRAVTITKSSASVRFPAPAWSIFVVLFISSFYCLANRSHTDKSFFLTTRAPVSSACLRDYSNAPTYCDSALVKWLPVDSTYTAELGSDLAQNRLSVFAPEQQWTLQGDTILNNVRYSETAGAAPIAWSVGLDDDFTQSTDFRHLNLFVPTPDSVDWTVTLPRNLATADFRSAVAICKDAELGPSADGVQFEVFVITRSTHRKVFAQHLEPEDRRWIPFTFSLIEYAGQTITIRLTSEMGGNSIGDWPMYQYPRIDVTTGDDKLEPGTPAGFAPSNTDLSPEFHRPGPDDFRLEQAGWQPWKSDEMHPGCGNSLQNSCWSIDGSSPILVYQRLLDQDLSKYSDIYFQVLLTDPKDILVGGVQVFYVLSHGGVTQPDRSFIVPLLNDGKTHAYTYPVRLLKLSQGDQLAGLKIMPLANAKLEDKGSFSLLDFRLLKKSEKP